MAFAKKKIEDIESVTIEIKRNNGYVTTHKWYGERLPIVVEIDVQPGWPKFEQGQIIYKLNRHPGYESDIHAPQKKDEDGPDATQTSQR